MLFAVIKLCDQGRRLTRTEIEAQLRAVGDLQFCAPPQAMDAGKPRDPLKRPTRVAELRGETIGNIAHTLIASLMEPVVITISADGLVIFGYQITSAEGAGGRRLTIEHAQGWLVRHLAPGEKRMRRGDVPM